MGALFGLVEGSAFLPWVKSMWGKPRHRRCGRRDDGDWHASGKTGGVALFAAIEEKFLDIGTGKLFSDAGEFEGDGDAVGGDLVMPS